MPEITDEQRALAEPELAVLSAMAHGLDADPEKAVRIALLAMAASVGLDRERSQLYHDQVLASLGEAAKEALESMDPAKYEFQSEFTHRYIALGKAEGKVEGKAEGKAEGEAAGKAALVLRQLELRFGGLSTDVVDRVRAASAAELDCFAERLLSAPTLDDALDSTR